MLKNIAKLRPDAVTHLITAENVCGKKGAGAMAMPDGSAGYEDALALGQFKSQQTPSPARELGQGYKVRPNIYLPPQSLTTLMDVAMSGCITHIWITTEEKYFRDIILRCYWDGETQPSVEVPLGDFFCAPFCKTVRVTSIPVNVNPSRGSNCFFPMPFRRSARITVENRNPKEQINTFFYAISFEERPVAEDECCFHAQFRRENPTDGMRDYTILDGVIGDGHYVGTSLGWQQNAEGWWGEGEVKMFIDGDKDFASYVGTGTEDYFGGAWGFFGSYSAPFMGYQDLSNVLDNRETNRVGNRHAMYRFHLPDPVRFHENLRVTIQTLGWRSEGRFLPLKDDVSSVAYWYQTEPHNPFPTLGSRDELEVI